MRILVFGGTGTIGRACVELGRVSGHEVVVASRTTQDEESVALKNDFSGLESTLLPFDGVIWAQGMNKTDLAHESSSFDEVMDANVGFIVKSFSSLYQQKLFSRPARLVLVSSVWQNLSREQKFSYTVSKSAINGLVNAFTADYAQHGIITNAVLPGVIESPMTRKNLSHEQIDNVINQTPARALVSISELAKNILWLASPESSGIAGQCITVDNGWSSFRAI